MEFTAVVVLLLILITCVDVGVFGNWLALLHGVAPHVLSAVTPMLRGMENMVSQRYGNFMTAEQVCVKMVEYAQEFYNMMERRCDVQKRSLVDDHFTYKITVGALVAALALLVVVFAVTVCVLRCKINALEVHQRDVMMAMQNFPATPRPGKVARA